MPNARKAAVKKAPPKRKLAEEFCPGEVFTDLAKKSWKLGPVIGKGGFGCLYLADVNSSKSVKSDALYVIKVEPSDNGPLFTELKFYTRAAKPELIKKWVSSHKLKYLGVPRYWGSGLHEKNGKSYRFMVMDRFGQDLQKIFEASGKRFPRKTVLQLGLRILDVLEYIHEHEYVHGDIKASNLLLSYKVPHQVYLVDYGLAYRYCPDGTHKIYKEDPKRCHDGTLEYTSIDAHNGASPSRRGDLQILGFCMISWLCGSLPWEDNLKDPNYVKDSKINYTDNVAELMKKCFSGRDKPAELSEYMERVMTLNYSEKPPYQQFRDILLKGLENIGQKDDGILDFDISKNGVPAKPALETMGTIQNSYGSSCVSARAICVNAVTAPLNRNLWEIHNAIQSKFYMHRRKNCHNCSGLCPMAVKRSNKRRKLAAAAMSVSADEDDSETIMDEEKHVKKRKRPSPKAGATKPKLQKTSSEVKRSPKPRKRVVK